MSFYKVLNKDGTSPVMGHAWPLPKNGKPGAWVKAKGPLVLCENGVHLCDGEEHLLAHLGPVVYEAEVRGDIVRGDDKVAVREARLIRRIPQWNERTARLFACLCAERVLPIFEAEHPDDSRSRDAIAVARRFADGDATGEELVAAWAAAWDAAGVAAGAAAWDAAGVAAGAAAWAAAWDAAWAAAWDAAWAAAKAAARDAAEERVWQAERLRELLTAPGDWT